MDSMISRCVQLAKSMEGSVKLKDGLTIEKCLMNDLLEYCVWVASLDGKIQTQELITISNLLGDGLNERYKEISDKYIGNTMEYLKEIPYIFKVFFEMDKLCGNDEWLTNSRYLHKTFKQIGSVIIACNGSRLSIEVNNMQLFSDKILKTICDREQNNDILNFVKEDNIEINPLLFLK